MALFEIFAQQFPAFREFLDAEPDWYKSEMDYPVARRLLDFAVALEAKSDVASLQRLFLTVEAELSARSILEDALCLDFVQPIVDLPTRCKMILLQFLGPDSRACYEAQFEAATRRYEAFSNIVESLSWLSPSLRQGR